MQTSPMMIGLGCEVMQITRFMREHRLAESDGFRAMTIQHNGGTRKTIQRGIELLDEMLPAADACCREAVGADALTIILENPWAPRPRAAPAG